MSRFSNFLVRDSDEDSSDADAPATMVPQTSRSVPAADLAPPPDVSGSIQGNTSAPPPANDNSASQGSRVDSPVVRARLQDVPLSLRPQGHEPAASPVLLGETLGPQEPPPKRVVVVRRKRRKSATALPKSVGDDDDGKSTAKAVCKSVSELPQPPRPRPKPQPQPHVLPPPRAPASVAEAAADIDRDTHQLSSAARVSLPPPPPLPHGVVARQVPPPPRMPPPSRPSQSNSSGRVLVPPRSCRSDSAPPRPPPRTASVETVDRILPPQRRVQRTQTPDGREVWVLLSALDSQRSSADAKKHSSGVCDGTAAPDGVARSLFTQGDEAALPSAAVLEPRRVFEVQWKEVMAPPAALSHRALQRCKSRSTVAVPDEGVTRGAGEAGECASEPRLTRFRIPELSTVAAAEPIVRGQRDRCIMAPVQTVSANDFDLVPVDDVDDEKKYMKGSPVPGPPSADATIERAQGARRSQARLAASLLHNPSVDVASAASPNSLAQSHQMSANEMWRALQPIHIWNPASAPLREVLRGIKSSQSKRYVTQHYMERCICAIGPPLAPIAYLRSRVIVRPTPARGSLTPSKPLGDQGTAQAALPATAKSNEPLLTLPDRVLSRLVTFSPLPLVTRVEMPAPRISGTLRMIVGVQEIDSYLPGDTLPRRMLQLCGTVVPTEIAESVSAEATTAIARQCRMPLSAASECADSLVGALFHFAAPRSPLVRRDSMAYDVLLFAPPVGGLTSPRPGEHPTSHFPLTPRLFQLRGSVGSSERLVSITTVEVSSRAKYALELHLLLFHGSCCSESLRAEAAASLALAVDSAELKDVFNAQNPRAAKNNTAASFEELQRAVSGHLMGQQPVLHTSQATCIPFCSLSHAKQHLNVASLLICCDTHQEFLTLYEQLAVLTTYNTIGTRDSQRLNWLPSSTSASQCFNCVCGGDEVGESHAAPLAASADAADEGPRAESAKVSADSFLFIAPQWKSVAQRLCCFANQTAKTSTLKQGDGHEVSQRICNCTGGGFPDVADMFVFATPSAFSLTAPLNLRFTPEHSGCDLPTRVAMSGLRLKPDASSEADRHGDRYLEACLAFIRTAVNSDAVKAGDAKSEASAPNQEIFHLADFVFEKVGGDVGPGGFAPSAHGQSAVRRQGLPRNPQSGKTAPETPVRRCGGIDEASVQETQRKLRRGGDAAGVYRLSDNDCRFETAQVSTSFGVVRRAVHVPTLHLYDIRIVPKSTTLLYPAPCSVGADASKDTSTLLRYVTCLPYVQRVFGVLADDENYYVIQTPLRTVANRDWVRRRKLAALPPYGSGPGSLAQPGSSGANNCTSAVAGDDTSVGGDSDGLAVTLDQLLQFARVQLADRVAALRLIYALVCQLVVAVVALHGKGCVLGPQVLHPRNIFVEQCAVDHKVETNAVSEEPNEDHVSKDIGTQRESPPATSNAYRIQLCGVGVASTAWGWQRQQHGTVEYLPPSYVLQQLGHVGATDMSQTPWTVRDDYWLLLCVVFDLFSILLPPQPADEARADGEDGQRAVGSSCRHRRPLGAPEAELQAWVAAETSLFGGSHVSTSFSRAVVLHWVNKLLYSSEHEATAVTGGDSAARTARDHSKPDHLSSVNARLKEYIRARVAKDILEVIEEYRRTSENAELDELGVAIGSTVGRRDAHHRSPSKLLNLPGTDALPQLATAEGISTVHNAAFVGLTCSSAFLQRFSNSTSLPEALEGSRGGVHAGLSCSSPLHATNDDARLLEPHEKLSRVECKWINEIESFFDLLIDLSHPTNESQHLRPVTRGSAMPISLPAAVGCEVHHSALRLLTHRLFAQVRWGEVFEGSQNFTGVVRLSLGSLIDWSRVLHATAVPRAGYARAASNDCESDRLPQRLERDTEVRGHWTQKVHPPAEVDLWVSGGWRNVTDAAGVTHFALYTAEERETLSKLESRVAQQSTWRVHVPPGESSVAALGQSLPAATEVSRQPLPSKRSEPAVDRRASCSQGGAAASFGPRERTDHQARQSLRVGSCHPTQLPTRSESHRVHDPFARQDTRAPPTWFSGVPSGPTGKGGVPSSRVALQTPSPLPEAGSFPSFLAASSLQKKGVPRGFAGVSAPATNAGRFDRPPSAQTLTVHDGRCGAGHDPFHEGPPQFPRVRSSSTDTASSTAPRHSQRPQQLQLNSSLVPSATSSAVGAAAERARVDMTPEHMQHAHEAVEVSLQGWKQDGISQLHDPIMASSVGRESCRERQGTRSASEASRLVSLAVGDPTANVEKERSRDETAMAPAGASSAHGLAATFPYGRLDSPLPLSLASVQAASDALVASPPPRCQLSDVDFSADTPVHNFTSATRGRGPLPHVAHYDSECRRETARHAGNTAIPRRDGKVPLASTNIMNTAAHLSSTDDAIASIMDVATLPTEPHEVFIASDEDGDNATAGGCVTDGIPSRDEAITCSAENLAISVNSASSATPQHQAPPPVPPPPQLPLYGKRRAQPDPDAPQLRPLWAKAGPDPKGASENVNPQTTPLPSAPTGPEPGNCAGRVGPTAGIQPLIVRTTTIQVNAEKPKDPPAPQVARVHAGAPRAARSVLTRINQQMTENVPPTTQSSGQFQHDDKCPMEPQLGGGKSAVVSQKHQRFIQRKALALHARQGENKKWELVSSGDDDDNDDDASRTVIASHLVRDGLTAAPLPHVATLNKNEGEHGFTISPSPVPPTAVERRARRRQKDLEKQLAAQSQHAVRQIK